MIDADAVAKARESHTPLYVRVRFAVVGETPAKALPRVLSQATADCEALLKKLGATGAVYCDPTVHPEFCDEGGVYVLTMARYFPGDEPKAEADA